MHLSFLGAGTERAGSTWLDACLREHPQVLLPVVKELHFFSSYYSRGVEWYHSCFELPSSKVLIGEVSPSYLRSASAAERIYSYNHDIRLIFILRDPIQRAYSHYLLNLVAGADRVAIDAALATESWYVTAGLYYEHLLRYLRFFGRERMLILLYDDLKKDPKSVFSAVCEFLDIDGAFIPRFVGQRFHARKRMPRYPCLANRLSGMSSYVMNKTGYSRRMLTYLKRKKVFTLYHRVNFTRPVPELTRRRHNELADFYISDVQKLSELLARDLSGWLQYEESGESQA